jgi:hypothetical protein
MVWTLSFTIFDSVRTTAPEGRQEANMRQALGWSVAAGLAVCVLVEGGWAAPEHDTYQSVREAAAAKRNAKPKPWWSYRRWLPEKTAKTETARAETAKKPEEKDEPAAPRPADDSVMLAQEREKLFRRQQVCLELQRVAVELDDPRLRAQAELLEQRAWLLYEQHAPGARLSSLLPIDTAAAETRLMAPAAAQAAPTTPRVGSAPRPFRKVVARGSDSPAAKEE